MSAFSAQLVQSAGASTLSDECSRFASSGPRPLFGLNLDWLSLAHGDDLEVLLLREGAEVRGVAPVVNEPWNVDWRGNGKSVGREVAGVSVLGERLLTEHDQVLFTRLVEAYQDAPVIRFRRVACDALLWQLLQTDLRRAWRRWRFVPAPIAPNWVVEIGTDYDGYLQERFSRKARYNLRREARLLEQVGPVQLRRYRAVDEVDELVDALDRVASDSPRGRRYVIHRSREQTANELRFWAGREALLAYVLHVGSEPVAFVLGYLAEETFHTSKVAFRGAYRKYSPGKALWHEVVADLHAEPACSRLDFGYGDAEYKRRLATDHYDVVPEVLLIRQTVRDAGPWFPAAAFRAARRPRQPHWPALGDQGQA